MLKPFAVATPVARLLVWSMMTVGVVIAAPATRPLGLPPLPVPPDNPQSADKIALGDRLYHDTRFSADGKVSCATCHAREKAFTDHRRVARGFQGLTGTRNAPTVINAAYYTSQFWDGREASLESQSKQPPVNPVEGGLASHQPILSVIKADAAYRKAFGKVFRIDADTISMEHVSKAIASFERTLIAGDSPFDRYQYGGEENALDASQKRGLALFRGKARCVSCHVIEQDQALFTDNRFHNIGVGFKKIQRREALTAKQLIEKKRHGEKVDTTVLTRENLSEMGRFAVTENPAEVGAFKTPTLRNVAVTFPYMHDGSLKTLADVVTFYNNGGRLDKDDPVSDFLSGGIRPLGLSRSEERDLVAFLESLTSPQYANAGKP